jgi:hypothetical protein
MKIARDIGLIDILLLACALLMLGVLVADACPLTGEHGACPMTTPDKPPKPTRQRNVCGPIECAPTIEVTCGADTAGIIAACAEAGASAAADAVATVTCPAAPACICPAPPTCPDVKVTPACAKYGRARGGVKTCKKWVVPVISVQKIDGYLK